MAGRCWHLPAEALDELARTLAKLDVELEDPDLRSIARWTAAGLSAYDATYVALAEARAVQLTTDDEQILAVAPAIASRLGAPTGVD